MTSWGRLLQIMAEICTVFWDHPGMLDCSWKWCHMQESTDHARSMIWPREGRGNKTHIHTKGIQSVYRLLALVN